MTYAQLTAKNRDQYPTGRRVFISKDNIKAVIFKSIVNIIAILAIICLLFVVYLMQIRNTNSHSYTINNLKEEQALLEAQSQALLIEKYKLESNLRAVNTNDQSYTQPTKIYFD